MTFSRLHITVFLVVSVLLWWACLALYGVAVDKDYLSPFGIVVGVLVVLGIAFEHLVWRWPILHNWFVKRPDLRGTWRVELQSDWIDPRTGEGVPLNVCYMGVNQTLSTLKMHLMTSESESWLIAENIRPSQNGDGYQVAGVYTNKPLIHLRGDRSEIHLGALVLDTHGPANCPESLTGEYWADRKTTGTLNFTAKVEKVVTRYEDAAKLFDGS